MIYTLEQAEFITSIPLARLRAMVKKDYLVYLDRRLNVTDMVIARLNYLLRLSGLDSKNTDMIVGWTMKHSPFGLHGSITIINGSIVRAMHDGHCKAVNMHNNADVPAHIEADVSLTVDLSRVHSHIERRRALVGSDAG